MKLSLQTKISGFTTLIVVAISLVSTYLFITTQSRDIERELIARGMALSYSLSKAAEEGLVKEDLDLLAKATYLIKAEDVTLVQAYSTLWDGIDAYPFERLREPPHPAAARHFEKETTPFHIRTEKGYEFYRPIFFTSPEDSASTIGFVRLVLSSAHMQREIRRTVIVNILVSASITLFALLAMNALLHHLVISPVKALRKSISMFRSGTLKGDISPRSGDEIGELLMEFNTMTSTINEKEHRLVESEKRIKSLFERVEHAIFRLDGAGNVTETNRRFDEMFGTVKKLCSVFRTEGSDISDCIEAAASEPLLHVEKKAFDKSGNDIVVLLSLYPETGRDGNLTGFDGYIIDITEKKRFEEALLHTQKMDAIGTLAGGIAHDFNNMLQGILGYTSLIKINLTEEDPLYKPINVIENSAGRASDLTKQLLGFARGGKYITKAVDLNTAVSNVLQIVSRTFDRAIEIRTSLSRDLWPVEADQSQIEHSLLNLCLNARDAMPSGGSLSITTANYRGVLSSAEAREERYAVVKVADTGTGMDKDLLGRIFEPFFTTKKDSKGVGMGLAMVYGVIKNHGGTIKVDSEPGKGSEFSIYLPASEKPVEAEVPVTSEIPRGKGTVLIVDDEDVVRDFAIAALARCGYKAIGVSNGLEALELFSRKKDEIGVVILDIIMPKMGGKETFEKLREIDPKVKVLVSSGYSINGTAREILEEGANGFLQKPFSVKALGQEMSRLFGS
ncbi:MAG TPA: ATP-binding protein [Dissulfurispiraceae bacterium]